MVSSSFARYFNNFQFQQDQHTNFKIKTADREFFVHKLVLSTNSGFYRRLFANQNFVEEQEIREDSSHMIQLFLKTLYKGDVPDEAKASAETSLKLMMGLNYYEVSNDILYAVVENFVHNLLDHDSFFKAIKVGAATNNAKLEQAAFAYFQQHGKELLQREEFDEIKDFDLVEKMVKIGFDKMSSLSPMMTVYVKTLTGRKKGFECYPNTTTVQQLKLLIQESEGIPPNHQALIYKGKRVCYEDHETLSNKGITPGAVLDLVLR